MAKTFRVEDARAQFAALRQGQVFMDNAGGSQTLDTVADTIRDYLRSTNVQLGATYPIASESTRLVAEGWDAAAKYINAKSSSEIVLGSSTTQLFHNLSSALYDYFTPGEDEIVLSQLDHEANLAPWVRLAARLKLKVKWWKGDDAAAGGRNINPLLTGENLKPLLSEKTKLVACTHASNILGTVHDIKSIANVLHETVPGALLCVDGVTYAPHRAIDLQDLGVDFYSFSWYKVYGPHMALLYASTPAQKTLTSLGHYFKTADPHYNNLETKLGLAGSSYELAASLPKIISYLSPPTQAWEEIAKHEEILQGLVLDYLNSKKDVTIYGQPVKERAKRIPVISFSVKGCKSQDVVEEVERRSKYGIRWGHFYSHRLVTGVLGLEDDGVVRISLVHYNTEEEVKGLLQVLDDVLGGKTDKTGKARM